MKYTKQALLVFILLCLMYGYYFHNPGTNGNSRLGLVFALVQDQHLAIDLYFNTEGTRTTDYAIFNGHYYTDKAIGTSVIGALVYAPIYQFLKLAHYQLDLQVIKYILTFLEIGIPSAFAGSLVYVLCETISRCRLRAYLATLAITLGTMVLPFSSIYFGHQLAGAFLFCSFFLIFQLKLEPGLGKNWGYLFLIGLLLGAAFLTEYTSALVILPLSIFYLYTFRSKLPFRQSGNIIVPFALGSLIPISILLIYNAHIYGNPFSIGYEHLGNEFQTAMTQGFLGISWPRLEVLFYLTFHPAQGIFWQSPVLLMSMLGFFYLWRDKRFRPEAIVVSIAFVGFLLFNSGYFMWWGGATFAPRHLIPMVLFLAIPMVMLPKRWSPLVILLAVISIGQMLIPLANDMLSPNYYFSQNPHLSFFGYSTIYSYSLPQLLEGNFAYNLGEIIFGWDSWLVLLPPILAILVVTTIFVIVDRRQPRIQVFPSANYR